MTHTMDEINDAVPGGMLFIQTFCGCVAKVYLLEHRANIEYCSLHKAAPKLLEACKIVAEYDNRDADGMILYNGEYYNLSNIVNLCRSVVAITEGSDK